jgi:hypothetical protein
VRDRNRDHDINNDDFRGFVGRSDLFDDFLLIESFLCDLFDLFRYYLALLFNKLN